jgi:hypothetical protein
LFTVFLQEQSTALHLDPDPSSQLVVITEILKKYKRNNRVVVISHETQSNWASELLELLHSTSSSSNDVLLRLTTKHEANYYKILSRILASNVRAVVLALERNLALDLINAAEQFGFADVDCMWILQHSVDGTERIPLLGKLLGVRLSSDHDNRSHGWREALVKDSIKVLEKTFQNISHADFEISSLRKDCRSSKRWLSGKSFYR